MTFRAGQMRVFDRSGAPMGVLTGFSITGPRSYRLNEADDMTFTMPRNDGSVSLIYEASDPTVVGTPLTATGASTVTLNSPAGTATGDVLIAAISYTRGGTYTASVAEPAGWRYAGVRNNGTNVGVAVFTRVVRDGDPTSHQFTVPGTSSGGILCLRGLRHDLVRGARINEVTTSVGTSTTAHSIKMPAALKHGFTLVVAGGSAQTTYSSTLTERVDTNTAISLAMYSRYEALATVGGDTVALTSGASESTALVALAFDPAPGTFEMLQADNLVFIENETTMPAWAGAIEDPVFSDGSGQVRCYGGLSLCSALFTTTIEQDEGDASDIAYRLLAAANAKKAAHGDMLIGFVKDDTKPNYGTYTYEGEISQGLTQLADRTLSEFYFASAIDATTGYLTMTLHWGSEYNIDKTSLILKDGSGGNLSPGTTISFTGSEVTNYARLTGTETNLAEHLDYPSVLNLTRDIVPEVTAAIPAPAMPGARRRERLDVSVDWGLPKAREKALAKAAQSLYLAYYKQFLYGFHARFGMPFLEGFDWSGPESSQFMKLSGRHYRTAAQLGFLGDRAVVTDWDPDADADVTLEGWWHLREIDVDYQYNDGAVLSPVSVAYDFTETSYRWILTARAVHSMQSEPDHDVSPPVIYIAPYSGESGIAIASVASEPTTVWVLVRSTTSSVRSYDVVTGTMLTSWTIGGTAYTDLAVDPTNGAVYLSASNTGNIEKRDINNGVLLDTFTTNLTNGRGISLSGPILYLINSAGSVEMRFATSGDHEGDYAATHQSGRSGATGLLVDVEQSQVWIARRTGFSVYSAAIAIDESEGNGPVDGAPGFDRISKARFVRIVMTDNRNFGIPTERFFNLLSIQHVNQYGRYVNGVWTTWSAITWPNGDHKNYSGVNCAYAAGAMLLDRHTFGTLRKTPNEMRYAANDREGGGYPANIAKAFQSFGQVLYYDQNLNWSRLKELLREGHGVALWGDMDQLPDSFKCQAGFDGNHVLYLHKIDGQGRAVAHDPMCRRFKRIPMWRLKKYAGKYHGVNGKCVAAWSQDTTGTITIGGKARTFFIVWSEGRWKDEYVAGAPGEPTTVTRTWDAGDQKKGFKDRDTVHIANPAQVIYGEEGRVGDWDPSTMGYGAKGTHYYKATNGKWMAATGWHLVPWDVPLEVFSLGMPDWPEGEAFLTDALERWNREQGAQVLGVVNIDGIWSDIELGARFTVQATLQGPHPNGVQGEVRVIAFTPDENTGTCQIMAEWMGAT